MRLQIRGQYPADWPLIATRTRQEAGHRCVRCHHRYVPSRDAGLLGLEASKVRWSACDEQCIHAGPIRIWIPAADCVEARWWETRAHGSVGDLIRASEGHDLIEAEWRVLTVHHLDGDKANCRWWNLLALCQVCHLYIQGKVIPERPWLFEHTPWFKPYVAGFYAFYHAGAELSRAEVEAHLDTWLELGQPWLVDA